MDHVESVIFDKWIEDLPIIRLDELPSKVTDRTEERKRQLSLRKLRRDLHALGKGHKFKVKHLPTVPGKQRTPVRNRLAEKRPVAKQPEVTKQPDGRCEYVNLKMVTSASRNMDTVSKELLKGVTVCPQEVVNSKTEYETDSPRKSTLRMLDSQNHVASPKRLLRMFAERFNTRKKSMSPARKPVVAGRVHRPQKSISRLSSTGCGSMTNGSGFICTLTSCQLSSADCTKSTNPPYSCVVPPAKEKQEETKSTPSAGEQDSTDYICLSELSSINHVTRGEYSYCHLVDEQLRYPQSSTPTRAQSPLSGTPPATSCFDSPSGIPTNTVKRALSETFTVFPPDSAPTSGAQVSSTEDCDQPDTTKPKARPAMGVLAKQRSRLPQGPAAPRPPCLGAEGESRLPSNANSVAKDTVAHSNPNLTLDSDATAFMQGALCHRAVTYKMKVNRRSKVKGQLRVLGRQIRELGVSKLNLHTLAVL